jgi:hypothetical protein
MALSILQTNDYEVVPVLSFNTQTGTTYTPVLGDGVMTLVTLNNASAITLTIPPNSSVAYPVGTVLNFAQIGAGQVTFAQGSGVTITSVGGTASAPKIKARYGTAAAIQTSANNWLVVGNIE